MLLIIYRMAWPENAADGSAAPSEFNTQLELTVPGIVPKTCQDNTAEAAASTVWYRTYLWISSVLQSVHWLAARKSRVALQKLSSNRPACMFFKCRQSMFTTFSTMR